MGVEAAQRDELPTRIGVREQSPGGPMTARADRDVVVIGAGVIGLTTALCLAERGLRVEVRAQLASLQTMSAVAAAMAGPPRAPASHPDGRRERASIARFAQLDRVPGTGVRLRRGRVASREPLPVPDHAVPCALDDLPRGFAAGYWVTVPLVDMPVYLEYLTRRLAAAHGRVVLGTITSLTELADEVPLIVNSAGLGARELTADQSLTPLRGQQVIVENPGLDEFFTEIASTPEWVAYWPHPGHVVLGGTQSSDDNSMEPDRQLAARIVARCTELEPRLASAAVRGHQVGFRPARATPRLEVQQIGGARCVHNYGHAGSGVRLSWSAALTATALLLDE